MKTNTTFLLLQVAILSYNEEYYNQKGLARFHNDSLWGWNTKEEAYFSKNNVFDFNTMVGLGSLKANGSF